MEKDVLEAHQSLEDDSRLKRIFERSYQDYLNYELFNSIKLCCLNHEIASSNNSKLKETLSNEMK